MTTSTATNPFNPATQFDQWLGWEKTNAGGSAPAAAKPPAAAPTPPPVTNTPGVKLPGTAPTPPTSTYTPKPQVNYAQQNADQKAALQLAGGGLRQMPGNAARVDPGGTRYIYNGVVYTKDPTTSVFTTNGYTPSKADTQSALQQRAAANTQQQNVGLKNAIATSALPPEQRAGTTAIANSAGMMGTLGTNQGVTLPGMGEFNVPGAGFAQEGRHTLYDSGELNTLHANQDNGPQIQFGPGQRNGRTGNAIVFGNSREGGGYDSRVAPQMLFDNVRVSVPDSYVKGAGNVNDANRAYEVPFNIGPGGASSMSIGGSNVQLNSADKGTGYGFAITPQTPSARFAATDVGAATGRQLSSDPALNAAQTLALNTAINQMGGGTGAITALTAPNAAQYSGNPAQGQGTWFAGAAPGPQATPIVDALTALLDQKDAEGGGGGGGGNYGSGEGYSGASYAKGGSVIMLPRTARASRPLGFASGGSVTAPNDATNNLSLSYGTPTIPNDPGVTSVASTPGINVFNDPNAAAGQDASNSPPPPDPYAGGGYTGGGYTGGNGGIFNPPPTPTDPTPTTAPPTTTTPPTTPTTPTPPDPLGNFNALDPNLLNPYLQSQIQENARQRLRDATNYQWKMAGVNTPTGLDVPIDYEGNAPLPSGQYYSKTKALNDRINGVTATQDQIRSLTGTGKSAQDINTAIATIKGQMGPLGDIADTKAKLTALGGPIDTTSLSDTLAMWDQNIGPVKQAIDAAAAAGQPANPSLLAQLAAYEESVAPLKASLSSALSHNANYQSLTSSLNNLIGATGLTPEQVTSQVGAYQTQLDTLNTQLGNLNKAADLRQKVYNLTKGSGLPGFSKGGWIKTATSNAHGQFAAKAKAAGMSTKAYAGQHLHDTGTLGKQARLAKTLMGFKDGGIVMPKPKGKKSMVTPEEIVGIGRQSGKPYFRVGEPRRPGGPPAPEKLTITPLPMRKRKKVAA